MTQQLQNIDGYAGTAQVGFDGTNFYVLNIDSEGRQSVKTLVWNSSSLAYEAMTQPLVKTDTLTVSATTDLTKIGGAEVGENNALYVQPGNGATFPVSGTFWPETQPVSIASMPSTPVTGTFYPDTQPVSASTLPLPTGAPSELSDEQFYVVLRQLIGAIRDPVWLDMVTNTLKISGAVTTSGTVSTVTTVTGLTNIGGYSADNVTQDMSRVAWGNNVRSLLT